MHRVQILPVGDEYVASLNRRYKLLICPSFTEVVLVELLSRFKFELGEHKNIYWQMGGIATPIIDENSTLDPQLPLKVTALKGVKT